MDLRCLETLEGYRAHFMDTALWSAWIDRIIHHHFSQRSVNIRPGIAGTFPTFTVDKKWVVKFFGRHFSGHQSFQVERTASKIISQYPSFPTADLIACGEISPREWFYLVFQYLPGVPFEKSFDHLSSSARCKFAGWIGKHLRQLHQIPLDLSMLRHLPTQNTLFTTEPEQILEKHRRWGYLPDHLTAQIPEFLERSGSMETAGLPSHLIHADLTGDHFLGSIINDCWQTYGVIDFGDAMIGHLNYEMVALHLGAFRQDKEMLRAFLDGYELSGSARANLPVWCMRAALMHLFNVFEEIPSTLLHAAQDSIENLAVQLWGTS